MSEKIVKLRQLMKQNNLDGLIIPHSDEFGEEIIADDAKRLEWLTGFTGSAGVAFIFMHKAFLLVDGRYTEQAKDQVDETIFTVLSIYQNPPSLLVEQNLSIAKKLGFDPKLHSIASVSQLRKCCAKSGAMLIPVKENLVDKIWLDKPVASKKPVFLMDEKYVGEKAKEKIAKVAEILKKEKEDAAIISSPSSICWLLNVRGGDVMFSPLVHSYAIVYATGMVDWFVDADKLSVEVRTALGDSIHIFPLAILEAEIERLAKKRKLVRLDANENSAWLENVFAVYGGNTVMGVEPCLDLKAVKNEIEIAGMRNAHIKDAVALCRFFCWLEKKGVYENLDEYALSLKLCKFRQQQDLFFSESFETIAASGSNSSVVHYSHSENRKSIVNQEELFLLDSGGQYFDGTTDVTRTIAFKPQNDKVKIRFTEVLKGHMAIACAVFPKGTYGCQLDVLARQFLWKSACDYAHGTGHGVGFFLGVHETPPSISYGRDSIPLMEGMVVTNEPAYYKTGKGAFGIRLENLMLVKKSLIQNQEDKENSLDMLEFEPLTLVPFEVSLIKKELLSEEEKKWLNSYHNKVFTTISPYLEEDEKVWLQAKTAPIS